MMIYNCYLVDNYKIYFLTLASNLFRKVCYTFYPLTWGSKSTVNLSHSLKRTQKVFFPTF